MGTTFEQHAREALDAHPGRESSVTRYRGIVKRWLLPVLGALYLEEVGPQEVDAVLVAARGGGLGEKSVRDVLTCLRSVLQKGVEWQRIPRNPCEGFRVRVRRRGFHVLTPAQVRQLDEDLRQQAQTQYGPAEILLVLLWTGLRIGEALALRPGDFDEDAQELQVRASKSDAGVRYVDVPDRVVGLLRRVLRMTERPDPTTLRRHLAAACERIGVRPLRVHDLRHTRVTTQLLAGVPVGYVSDQAGHASPSFTLERYDHWCQAATRAQRREWANAK